MGLARYKFFKILFIILAVSVLSQISAETSNSQEVVKEIENCCTFSPGDEVDINIRLPGANSIQPNPVDVMLVMDRSGSMGGVFTGLCQDGSACAKIEAAQDAMKIFVDNVSEGVFAGLVTYSFSSSTTLDCGIKVMTDTNKIEISSAIDSFSAGGNTAIGRGMEMAIEELLNEIDPLAGAVCSEPSTSRHDADIRKVIILATDGKQNNGTHPISGGILQRAIDEEITVFTIGIGSSESDIDEALLKKIACDTDQFDDDTCEAGNPTNNLSDPTNYAFIQNTDDLNDFYEEIAAEITAPTAYGIIDTINTNIFSTIVPGSLTADTITNCGSGSVWPSRDLFVGGSSFFFTLDPIPEGTEVCIRFSAILKDPFPFALFDTSLPVNIVGIAASVDPDFSCSGLSLIQCVLQLASFPRVDIINAFLTVENPVKPWLKTTGGDVGSFSAIDNIVRDISGIDFNADYLVISDNSIDPKFITRGWKIENYAGGIKLDPDPSGSTIYDEFDKKFPTKTSINNLAEIGSGDDAVIVGSNLIITGATYAGPASVVFVPGDLIITGDFVIEADTGLVFIVGGDIEVTPNVKTIEGMFITNGKFHSRNNNCGSNISTPDQLVINGAVHAFGEFCFTRDLGADNQNIPAELINYEPKYLYLFGDIVGDPTVIYREVAP